MRILLSFVLSGCISVSLSAQPMFPNPIEHMVHYSPPQTGIYLGSPSLVRLPSGELIASMDCFGRGAPRPTISLIFCSTDEGFTWRPVAEIEGSFWANLFLHRGDLYLLGCDDSDGGIVIRRSRDKGRTWTTPDSPESGLLYPQTAAGRYHCAPMPVVEHKGRLYRAFENRPTGGWPEGFLSLVISADANADLLDASSWQMSNQLPYDQETDPEEYIRGSEDMTGGGASGWLEGNIVITPDDSLVNILRVNSLPVVDQAAVVQVHDEGKRVSFDPETGFIDFPGGMSKFTIRFDEESGRYWTIANGNTNPDNPRQRNSLQLWSSSDLTTWEEHVVLLEDLDDYPNRFNDSTVGFQYIDFQFDGDDILFLSRTAYQGARNYHDANFITFHRIEQFRQWAN